MAKTVRRIDWYSKYPKVKGFAGKKAFRDSSCKPGCGVCGKDAATKKTDNARRRRQDRQEIKLHDIA